MVSWIETCGEQDGVTAGVVFGVTSGVAGQDLFPAPNFSTKRSDSPSSSCAIIWICKVRFRKCNPDD